MGKAAQSPGTVSRILWHFTGGPLWNSEQRRQNSSPKPARDAFKNLVSILRSRELRLGSYKEVIRVKVDKRRKYDEQRQLFEVDRNVIEEITSSSVCCLADIPVVHLGYLAERYGKFAIGFHRHAVVRHGFNPVFYALDDADAVFSIYKGFTELENIDAEAFRDGAEYVSQGVEDFVADHGLHESPDLSGLTAISDEADMLESYISEAKESFADFLGLVKTFSAQEFGTIYCEREWRSLKPFKFDMRDVAMVVVPRHVGKTAYYQRLLRSFSRSSRLPRTIPVVPWEDLIEH